MNYSPEDPKELLRVTENMMQRSHRFLSLSGRSGVAIGLWALFWGWLAYQYLEKVPFKGEHYYFFQGYENWGFKPTLFFPLIASATLVGAVGLALFFSIRKARLQDLELRGPLTNQFLFNLLVPLLIGAATILTLLYNKFYINFLLAGPLMLVFYGLALILAGQMSHREVQYLGACEVALGIYSLYSLRVGLDLWLVGFGFLHILYGLYMWYRYERGT